MSQKINNRLIFEHFFTGENELTCICGKTRRQNVENVYTNLINVFTSHPNYKKVTPNEMENSCIVNSFRPTKKAKNVNSWLKWVIGKGLPFDFVEDKLTREIVNLDPISRGSLVSYIEKLTVEVENEIKSFT